MKQMKNNKLFWFMYCLIMLFILIMRIVEGR